MITIHLKYEIVPERYAAFATYAKLWMPLVEEYGGTHHGYFMPHESSNYIGYALFSFQSLDEYERYRTQSRTDERCVQAYEYAKTTGCIKRYERSFMHPIFHHQIPNKMNPQVEHYQRKLRYEMDPSDLFQSMNDGQRIKPVDARQAFGFEHEHIPGAINLPHREITAESTRHLDRSITYVTYCDGIGCNASTKGALKLAQLGFDVRELIGGLAWWKIDGYATAGTESVAGAPVQCAC